jgi:hypothetical protein
VGDDVNFLDRAAVVAYSRRVVALARANKWEKCGDVVGEIYGKFGVPGIQILMLGLADTVLIHEGVRHVPSNAVVVPVWMTQSGEVITDVEKVRPWSRWAGRFIAARGARDFDGCNALLESIPSDEQFLENLWGLVDVCANTLNTAYGPPKDTTT